MFKIGLVKLPNAFFPWPKPLPPILTASPVVQTPPVPLLDSPDVFNSILMHCADGGSTHSPHGSAGFWDKGRFPQPPLISLQG